MLDCFTVDAILKSPVIDISGHDDANYLVTAKIKTAPTWSQLDPNVTFGAFTFERLGT